MEIITKIQTYRVDKKCDKCNEGLMNGTGHGITQWKSKWEHRCDKCGDIQWYEDECYPKTIYEDIGSSKPFK